MKVVIKGLMIIVVVLVIVFFFVLSNFDGFEVMMEKVGFEEKFIYEVLFDYGEMWG